LRAFPHLGNMLHTLTARTANAPPLPPPRHPRSLLANALQAHRRPQARSHLHATAIKGIGSMHTRLCRRRARGRVGQPRQRRRPRRHLQIPSRILQHHQIQETPTPDPCARDGDAERPGPPRGAREAQQRVGCLHDRSHLLRAPCIDLLVDLTTTAPSARPALWICRAVKQADGRSGGGATSSWCACPHLFHHLSCSSHKHQRSEIDLSSSSSRQYVHTPAVCYRPDPAAGWGVGVGGRGEGVRGRVRHVHRALYGQRMARRGARGHRCPVAERVE
jgi:hypothetical protein